MIRRVVGIYFSPVGGTAEMTRRLASELAAGLKDCSPDGIRVDYLDISDFADAPGTIDIDGETVAVIGMPSYIGKLPVPGIRAAQAINGSGAMCIASVSYGGRSYGNALYEMQHIVEERGLRVIGAGAFLISYMAVRGSSRSSAPAMDTASLAEFVKAASDKIRRLAGCDIEPLRIKPAPLEVKGRMPVHKISRISPKAAAAAQALFERISFRRKNSEWFL